MALKSWIASANDPAGDFPLENLPYGVFRHVHRAAIGVAIGDQIFDLGGCASEGLLKELPSEVVDTCTTQVLNHLMALGPNAWSALRRQIQSLLAEDSKLQPRLASMLVPMRDADMQMPVDIGDYTDFYASIH